MAAVLAGLAVYDANKWFGGSLAAHGYFSLREAELTRLAQTLDADDSNIKVVGIAVNQSVAVIFEDYSVVGSEDEARLEAKYEPLLHALRGFPSGVFNCNGWHRSKDGVFCIGQQPAIPTFRSNRDPRVNLKYWRGGSHIDAPLCNLSMKGDAGGICEMPLSAKWTIHYEWLPKCIEMPDPVTVEAQIHCFT